ncbi:MAG: bifunctional NADP-dependent methylenetetrahydromethanopterin dehydrogenase/methylenetetrahydrofolate dehydrogenase [Planctomycetes bacterium]|nr:bifunctional NADP-dependent methylenetetrahydromethanopterin dehydrogenase/methylenetetrahydrofolate dehydrogenase [Planctomycetota bacterium]
MKNILLCLDTDPQPSVFDGVVAIDTGVEHLFQHGGVTPDQVRDLVHGAMFTRGGNALKHTAVFIGGSDVQVGEQLLAAAQKAFFGPVRVSLMLDSNGSNTTAAAAVVTARRHVPFGPETIATILGGTGPVGQRVVRMLAQEGVEVRVASRRISRAEGVCHRVSQAVSGARVTPHSTESSDVASLVEGVQLVIAAGAAGIELLSAEARQNASSLQVAIDLNAVPPAGLGGIELHDKAAERDGQICYGALGVGGLKMKIHKAAIARLFQTNDVVLDADEIYVLGKEVASQQ